MPIVPSIPLRRISQKEFGAMSFEVMRHVFEMHNDLGRFFDEKIYKRELARRVAGVRLETPIDFLHESFCKRYFLDVLLDAAGLFEFKAGERIVPRHRAQSLHYLFAGNLTHAKLINMRPESVEHEFINTSLNEEERKRFAVTLTRWDRTLPGAARVEEVMLALLQDWGAGLEVPLYEEALTHFLGGNSMVDQEVEVRLGTVVLGHQRFRLAAPEVAFKLTALTERQEEFEDHTRRLLAHTRMQALLWVNLTVSEITFTTLK